MSSEELVGIADAFIQGTKEHEKFIKENFTTQQYKALNEIAERIALAHKSGIEKGLEIARQHILDKGENAHFSVNQFSTQIARDIKEMMENKE